MERSELTNANCLVVKIGSSLITNNGLGLDRPAIENWAEQLVALQRQGRKLVLVSSGAVAEGVARLELTRSATCCAYAAGRSGGWANGVWCRPMKAVSRVMGYTRANSAEPRRSVQP